MTTSYFTHVYYTDNQAGITKIFMKRRSWGCEALRCFSSQSHSLTESSGQNKEDQSSVICCTVEGAGGCHRLSGTGASAMGFTCRWGLKLPSQRHREQRGSSGAERGAWGKDRSQHGTVTSDAPNPEQNNCQQQWTEHFKIFHREEFECFFFFWQRDRSI